MAVGTSRTVLRQLIGKLFNRADSNTRNDAPAVFEPEKDNKAFLSHDLFTADELRAIETAIGRPVDILVFNTGRPKADALARYAAERKAPLELGTVREDCDVVKGNFWRGDIARHDRRRLGTAVWAALAQKLCS